MKVLVTGLFEPAALHNADSTREISSAFFNLCGSSYLAPTLRGSLISLAEHYSLLAIQAAPSDYLCWLSMARIHAAQGNWDAAELCLARARQLASPDINVRMFPQPRLPKHRPKP